ncbi:hypothetical protein HRbin01_01257 [archaeon HR01]|nr:hypothetical protein HRbin01_01257 [archaeon HR01]
MARTANLVIKGLYRDSVQLMEATEKLKGFPGVEDGAVVMGTDSNKAVLRDLALLAGDGEGAGPNDIIIAVRATGDLEAVLRAAREMVLETRPTSGLRYGGVDEALRENPDISYASISVPGRYVSGIASRLLDHGVNLFIFSDHVPLDVEVELKRRAVEKGLLVMGPEAGTSIIAGVGFGFANKVGRGPVGVVASAGSGIQELTTILDGFGIGVSHAIGVGGRDLTARVGGVMTAEALKRLESDAGTRVIALLAKQSDMDVVGRVLDDVNPSKPVITCLLGYDGWELKGYRHESTIHGLALRICSMLEPSRYPSVVEGVEREVSTLMGAVSGPSHPRGFYCGGTLATETAFIWRKAGFKVYTNLGLDWVEKLRSPHDSVAATIVDYGAEEFTEGRPHPIIDPSLRNRRVSSELEGSDVSAVLMDLIIGYGAPGDVVARTLADLGLERIQGSRAKLVVRVVGSVSDPQWPQIAELRKRPLIMTSSNALAAAYGAACGLGDPEMLENLSRELIASR